MSVLQKRVSVQARSVRINAEIMYMRLLAFNAKKQVPLQRVMPYENAPVPLSIFAKDGSMTTCVKSDFLHKLENLLPEQGPLSIIGADAVIFNGHATIQMLPSHPDCFLRTWQTNSLDTY